MATNATDTRYRHVLLPTQQRRLRHLRLIAVRNIVQDANHTNTCDLTQIQTYITLHRDGQSEAFFTSDKISGTLNPTWRNIHFDEQLSGYVPGNPIGNSAFCIVRVWRGLEDNVKLFIEWSLHLDGLVFLCDRSQKDVRHYSPNTVLFGMLDGIYGVPMSPLSTDPRPAQIEVDSAHVRLSNSTQTLLRIKTIMRAVKQTQISVHKVKQAIEQALHHSNVLEAKKSQQEFQSVQNNLMRRDLDWRMRMCRAERETYENIRTENSKQEKLITSKFKQLRKDIASLQEKKKDYFDVREGLIKTGAQLVLRRKQLISELSFVYPIVEVTQRKVFTVCGVRLPDSEDFVGRDETMIAVGLGYTCHLVEMISHFLDVPPRYPMIHHGSRSMIMDYILDKLQDRERSFPLFGKGNEKFQFNYGVYLLNKNISQLRYYCGLGTIDLRMTLSNIKNLLEFRLGSRFSDVANTPVLSGQHTAIPPNLDGPLNTSPASSSSTLQNTSVIDLEFSSSQTNSSEKTPVVSNGIGESVDCEEHHMIPDVDSKEHHMIPDVDSEEHHMIPDVDSERHHMIPDVDSEKHHVTFPDVDDVRLTVRSQSSHDLANIQNSCAMLRTLSDKDLSSMSNSRGIHPAILKTSSYARDLSQSPMNLSDGCSYDMISEEKLTGAHYDDIDVESSEDSTSTAYASRFKMWPRDQIDVSQMDVNWTAQQEQISAPNGEDDSSMTFKTKAMTSPKKGQNSDNYHDVISDAGQNNVIHHSQNARQRTESDTDLEESATFVLQDPKHSTES